MLVEPTVVSYPSGGLSETATVVAALESGTGGQLVITDRTPFHPVDHRWPDQGPDTGVLVTDTGVWPVVDCLLVAGTADTMQVGADITARRTDPDWTWSVGHLLSGPAVEVGDRVELRVDAEHRAALSAGHTCCHLASLALNAALAGCWAKPAALDALGNPDFDSIALTSSVITPGGSIDRYRLGKSLRKKGFDAAAIDIAAAVGQIDRMLAGWVVADAPVRVEADGPAVTDLRTWVCELPEGTARIACGGTHLTRLGELSAITVALDLGADELVMTTSAG